MRDDPAPDPAPDRHAAGAVGPPHPATDGDVDALVEIIAAVAEEGWIGAEAPVDRDRRREQYRDALRAAPPSGLWVVRDGAAVVGYLVLPAAGPVGVVGLAMALLPAARGRGAGRALLDTAIAHAREHGAHRIELEVWLDNPRAAALYASAGFVVEGVRRARYRRRDGSVRSSLMMALLLDPDRGG